MLQPANRRLLSLPSLSTSDRIGMLLEYLDTFYTDVEGWNLLGELYMSLGLSVGSLSHSLAAELLTEPSSSFAATRKRSPRSRTPS